METHYIYIKNMVSDQCIATVQEIFKSTNIPILTIEPGRIGLTQKLDKITRVALHKLLQKEGFSLLINTELGIVNHIKCHIRMLVYHSKEKKMNVSFSGYLSKKTALPYRDMDRLFLFTEGQTITMYIAQQRVNRVKQLLNKYSDNYNTTNISIDLGYNSTSYLCMQFKQVTGQTIGAYLSSINKEQKMFSLR